MIQIDVIGTLYTPGTYDNEGATITAPVALPGWHVITTHPISAWAAKLVTPTAPTRVFGGAATVFYTFDDQAEFNAAMEGVDLTEPLPVITPPVDPCEWLLDIGPFFDRFGATKMAVLTSPDAGVKAVVSDVSIRKWIDLQRADVAAALAYIGSAVGAVTPALQTAILTTPVTEPERSALRKLYF
jgi:hypothetical protein